jgi:hypothetical protein
MSDLSISKAWDESREIGKRDGRLLAILALAFIGLPSLISTVFMPDQAAGLEDRSGGESLAILVAAIIALLGQLAIARMSLAPPTSVADAIRHGLRRLLPQIGAAVLAFCVLLGLCLPLVVLAMAMGVAGEATTPAALPALVLVGLLVTVAAVLFVAVRLMMMTPVAAAENVGPVAILARSWDLTRGHFWRLLGFLLMMVAALAVVSLAAAAVVGTVVIMLFGAVEPMSMAALMLGLAQGLLTALFTVVFVLMVMRIYVQLSGNSSIKGN